MLKLCSIYIMDIIIYGKVCWGKFGEFGESSGNCQTKTIQIIIIFRLNYSFTKLYYAKIFFHLVLPKIIICSIRYAPKFQELHPLILLKLLKLSVSAVFLVPLQHEISSTQLSSYLHTYVNTLNLFLLYS